MPYGGNPGPKEDMYGDNPGMDEEMGDRKEGMEEEEPHDTGMTASLPKDICPGMKEGDEMVLHIDKVTEDSYVVSYEP